MTVREFIDILKTLDQERNIWLVFDRFEYQNFLIENLGIDDAPRANSFKFPDYMKRGLDESNYPKDGDYFIDAY